MISNHEQFASLTGGGLGLGSLSEPGAGFLPFALSAPHLPVLHPVHLPALLGVTPGPSEGGLGTGAVRLGRQADILAGRLE